MRIVYVTDALAVWGGIERVLSDKTKALVQDYGCEVYIVTTEQGNHPIPYPLDERIGFRDLNIKFHQQYRYQGLKRFKKSIELELLFRNRMKELLDEIKPDIIVCIRDGNVNGILKIKGNIPLIFESHAMYKDIQFENSTFLHRLITNLHRRRFNRLDKIVTLTKGDAKDWNKVCMNVCVIPNLVHLNKSKCYSSCDNKNVIFAGRFNLQKDYGSLIEVWSIVQQRHSEWTLNVYGNGELKPFFEHVVAERGLRIIIHPAVSNIFEKYMDSSIFVMTSLYEPFGLVLVEAMSCGLPVVAFDCPYGPADIISDGIDGYLVENRNIQAFADCVCHLIENPEERKRFGKAGIQSSQRYRAEVIMPQWIQLFNSLLK